ncbi:MAG TPA: hypothetical protein VLH18_01715 [Candidatus Limnocylindrales bacterium]|nr:hypothetical protein [Candidatus Limnocylindrales bacterium]
MTKKKIRKKDLRKQRWVAGVALFLALGMVVSLLSVYFNYLGRRGEGATPPQVVEPAPEDYIAHFRSEIERLETFLETNQATPDILHELARNYHFLILFQQDLPDAAVDMQQYQVRLIEIYQSLVVLDPTDPQARLGLLNLYVEQQADEALIASEIAALQALMRAEPNPLQHLSLIGLLAALEEEDSLQEEVVWLKAYLEEKVIGGTANNAERLYYAVLLGEYFDSPILAEEQLNLVLAQEIEGSEVYQQARSYLNHLASARGEGAATP